MKTMTILALAGAAGMANAGQIFQESFEGDPGMSYTFSNQFDDAGFDFFGRYMVPDNSNPARDVFQSGWDGSFGIMGQDHDGDGEAATQSVMIDNIDIFGFTSLSMSMFAGALDSEAAGFFNFEAVDGDGMSIWASIDGGADFMIGRFSPPSSGAGDLYVDADMDGIGDGARPTTDLADFAFNIAGVGSSLDLRIDMTSTSSFEALAIDNIRVNGIPSPATLGLLGMAGLAGSRRRRA
ncbi:MAG: PEP-CTERM sorting domain-containing protein [Phycisphaerales bacterium]|nr:PEP-CTERM sorting domain-containing protein [Phycisphaerales bacterium]